VIRLISLIAKVEFLAFPANIALDLAAPDEAAIAFLLGVDPTCLVATSTAHQTAPVDGLGRLVAHPKFRSQYSQTESSKRAYIIAIILSSVVKDDRAK